jgi:2-oxoglutarate ferredoxin oxidoreductase subunit alpha
VVRPAIDRAREEGIKVGLVRLITVWPFCETRINELIAQGVKGFCMAELNLGQVFYELDRVVHGRANVTLAEHAGGTVHDPDYVYEKIIEARG